MLVTDNLLIISTRASYGIVGGAFMIVGVAVLQTPNIPRSYLCAVINTRISNDDR